MTIKRNTTLVLSLSSLALAISASVNAAPETIGFAPIAQAQTSPLPKRYIVKFKNAEAAQSISANNQQSIVSDESLPTTMDYQPQLAEISEQHRTLNKLQAKEMKRIGRSNSYTVKLDKKGIAALKSRADVEYVEEDAPRRLLSESTLWGQTYVGATQLSDSLTGNRTVCIIDSGYDRSHSDLSGNNVTGTNNSGTADWFAPGANNAHGTHVAGTIAAIGNGDGVIGVMPNQNVNIHVIKVFNAAGWGYSSSLVSAVDTCVSNGADVVSMSLGGPSANNTERNALAAHANNGVLLIAAAGNDGNNTHSYPASYDGVMSVASIDSNKNHSAFSQFTNQVEIAGPGEAVLSTVTRGEGRLADITIGGQSYFSSGVVPHNRYIPSGTSYTAGPYNGTATATLAECTVNGTTFNCGNMSNKVCLVERVANQTTNSYPETNPVKACRDAGASAVIVYSNTALPGLQNPFLLDPSNNMTLPTVSVDRATGLALRNRIGSSATVATQGNKDYAYYNGTSMATPHVSGVAALVWSYHPQCSAAQVRNALKQTAEDLGTVGRDNYYGFGLVNATAAKTFLDASCNGPTDPVDPGTGDSVLINGVAKTGLAGAKNDEIHLSFNVPAGASNLKFTMSGGTGDADLYVQYGAAPTTANYDCRPYKSGNTETCTINNIQSGTYYVMVRGYSAFSAANITASYQP